MASPDALRAAITYLHAAIAEHSSAQGKATLAACLAQMMQVQAKDHQAVGKALNARQLAIQRLTGSA